MRIFDYLLILGLVILHFMAPRISSLVTGIITGLFLGTLTYRLYRKMLL